MSSKKVILIDSRNMCYRAHFTHMRLSYKGQCTSCIFGIPNMLLAMQRKVKAPVIFCWDGVGETWRHKLTKNRDKQYKGNRHQANEVRKLINQQIPIVKEFLDLIGVHSFEVPNLEADDLIGILATALKNKYEVIIYSGDRDFFQLASDKIKIWCTQGKGKSLELIDDKKVLKDWGLEPELFVRMRAFCGDHSDNISKAMKGLGPKTSAKLIQKGFNPQWGYDQHSPMLQQEYKAKFEKVWPMIQENYILSKIITDEKNTNLTSLQRLKINGIYKKLIFGVERKTMNEATFRDVLNYCIKYGLDEIFEQRRQLSQIP